MSTLLANSLVKKNNNQACESDQAKQNRLNAKALHERVEKERTEKEVKVLEAKGYCIISARDLSDLESKQPVLYGQIYQKGVTDGKATANRVNGILNDINVKQKKSPEGRSPQKETVPEKDFETLVAEYQEKHKCRKGRAIMFVANSHPEEHKEYVAKLSNRKRNEPGRENAERHNGNKPKFKTLVDDYQAEHKCTRIEAIRTIAKSHPEEHK